MRMQLTFDDAVSEHRKMWSWMANKIEENESSISKLLYFLMNRKQIPINKCYCCQYASNISSSDEEFYCTDCPIIWPENNICNKNESLCKKFYHSTDWRLAVKYARQIANLPAREKTEEDI